MKKCACFLLFLGLGCTSKESSVSQFEVDLLKTKIESLETRISELSWKQTLNDRSTVSFSPDSDTFSRLDTNLGPLYVSLKNIKPYADGFKMTVNLGNPHNAAFKDPLMKVSWSPRVDFKVSGSYAESEKRKRTKEFKLQKVISPGSWNSTEITIAPATSEEVGRIEIEAEVETVSLRQ